MCIAFLESLDRAGDSGMKLFSNFGFCKCCDTINAIDQAFQEVFLWQWIKIKF